MSITRRNLFQMTGGAAGLLTAPGPFLAFDQFFRPAAAQAATINTIHTACGICSPNCGIEATVKDGALQFLKGIDGDLHGEGHLCGKGAAGGQFLLDPDRLKYPMKRTNPNKGFDEDPGWVRISWTEALDTIAERFRFYMTEHGRESLLFCTLPGHDFWSRFMNALGVVNRIDHIDVCFLTDNIIQRYTTGGKQYTNDFENSKYILLFGWDQVAKNKIVYANGIVKARANGAKVVRFAPTYTATSKMSTEYHNIRPGSDLAVALAMINVIISENLYDRDFVDLYTNFGQYESEIRTHFAQYTPHWASELSDVPAADIARIAREFATTRPAIAPAHKKTLCANYMNATQLVHAISILNILAGTIDRPGGRYFARGIPLAGADAIWPPPPYPQKLGRRVDGRNLLPLAEEVNQGMFSTLADGMLRRYPGMIKAAFWNNYTILGFPFPRHMEDAMRSVEFSVAMDVIPTDTTSMADIVLPSTTYLEGSGIVVRNYRATSPQAVARQPVSAPMFETKSIAYVALELGKRLVPDYFKKPDGAWLNASELLDEQARRANLGENFADFRNKGRVDRPAPFVPRTSFPTVGGTNKCQILVPQFAEKGAEPLPKWHPKRDQPSAEYPYYYLTFIPGVHKRNSTQNNAYLNELMPTNAAIIHPELAARLGIREGQMVRLTSRVGQLEVPAHLSPTLRPDCVQVAHGFGHRNRLLSKAGFKGVRDGDLVPDASTEDFVAAGNYGGSSCIMDAVVNIQPL